MNVVARIHAPVAILIVVLAARGLAAQEFGAPAPPLETRLPVGPDEFDELLQRLRASELTEYDVFRAPTRPVNIERIVPEWDPARFLVLAVPSHLTADAEVAESFALLIRGALEVTDVMLLVDDTDLGSLRRLFHVLHQYDLEEHVRPEPPVDVEVPRGALEHWIYTVPLPVDTYWTRDFGPLFGVTSERQLCLIDSAYRDVRTEISALAMFTTRRKDDTVPTILSGLLPKRYINAPVVSVRTPLQLWGGDFFTDGAGIGFTSTATLVMNGAEPEFVNTLLHRYYGVRRVVYLEPLPGRTIKHIDMFFRIAGPNRFILAEYDQNVPASTRYYQYFHEMIHATLERNRLLIESEFPGAEIIRVPIPPLSFAEDHRQMMEASLHSLESSPLDPDLWQLQAFSLTDTTAALAPFSDAAVTMALEETYDRTSLDASRSHRMRELVDEWRADSGQVEFPDPSAEAQEAQGLDASIQFVKELRLEMQGDPETEAFVNKLQTEMQGRLDELRPTSTYFTYLNAIHLRGEFAEKVFVPSFRRYRRFEPAVHAAYQRAYPDAEIVFIPADKLIEQFGALHCISCVIPDVASLSASR